MNHDHHHDHDHDHHHHDHNHGGTEMPFEEKIIKLLEHWIRHNEDHAKTYQEWADKAKTHHLTETAALIKDAAGINLEINKKFEQAKTLIQKKR